MDMVTSELTISVSEFKAKCLDIMKRLGEHRLRKVVVTRRGKPLAVVTQADAGKASFAELHGSMKGKTVIPQGMDIVGPIFEGAMNAEKGILYID